MSIYRTDYRKMTREVLLVAFQRLCIMKYDDLGKIDGLTREGVRKELAKVATELKRRKINVKVVKQVTINVPIESFISTGARKLETITI